MLPRMMHAFSLTPIWPAHYDLFDSSMLKHSKRCISVYPSPPLSSIEGAGLHEYSRTSRLVFQAHIMASKQSLRTGILQLLFEVLVHVELNVQRQRPPPERPPLNVNVVQFNVPY